MVPQSGSRSEGHLQGQACDSVGTLAILGHDGVCDDLVGNDGSPPESYTPVQCVYECI